MAKRTILVPDIGDYADVPVIEVLVKVGDVVVVSPTVQNMIALDTKVKRIAGPGVVQLDQILYKTISQTSTVTFKRELAIPTDYTINVNGVITTNVPVASGSVLKITAYSSTGAKSTLPVGNFKTAVKLPSSWFAQPPTITLEETSTVTN